MSKQVIYDDLTGGLNNVYSKEQVNSTTKKTETPDMVNVEYFRLGGIKTMSGNTRVGRNDNSIQDSSVVAGWEYTKNKNRYMLIGLANGEVRRYNQSLDTVDSEVNPFELVYKFPTKSPRMSFCNMNNGVVITNGIDDLVFYEINRVSGLHGVISITDGSNEVSGVGTLFNSELRIGDGLNINGDTYYVTEIVDNITLIINTPIVLKSGDKTSLNLSLADTSLCNAYLINTDREVDPSGSLYTKIRGLAIQYYNGRLWVGTDNGLFYSAVGLPNNWNIEDDAGVLYSVYNDSSKINALGLYSNYLMIHKQFSTYILTCTGESSTIEIKPFSNVTCESQQSWITSNTKYFVYSKDFMDIYPLVEHTIFTDKFLGVPITQKVRNIFKEIRQGDTSKIFCVSRPRERQMLFYLPSSDRAGSNTALIYDFQTKSFLLRKLPKDVEVTIAFNYDNRIYIGTKDGLVLEEFNGNSFTVVKEVEVDGNTIKTIDSKRIDAYYKTPWLDWAGNYNQSFAEFFVELDSDYRNKFFIRTQKDGTSRYEDRFINEEKHIDKTNTLVWDDTNKHWGGEVDGKTYTNDRWARVTFDTLRMLLPNNVFESFQLEFRTSTDDDTEDTNRGFHIYQYGFRRIETEEAPW